MEVYAAQIDRMDQGIGRILAALERTGQLDDTLVIFLADNGACAEDIPEDVHRRRAGRQADDRQGAHAQRRAGALRQRSVGRMPGPENTYQSYGTAWANLSNTPFRLYKHWIHEGGITTPLIVHWPQGIADARRHPPCAGLPARHHGDHPRRHRQRRIPPTYDGQRDRRRSKAHSLAPAFTRRHRATGPMFWEHEGNAAVRIGQWKLVRAYPGAWELYDMEADRTELHDLAAQHPQRVTDMASAVRRVGRSAAA